MSNRMIKLRSVKDGRWYVRADQVLMVRLPAEEGWQAGAKSLLLLADATSVLCLETPDEVAALLDPPWTPALPATYELRPQPPEAPKQGQLMPGDHLIVDVTSGKLFLNAWRRGSPPDGVNEAWLTLRVGDPDGAGSVRWHRITVLGVRLFAGAPWCIAGDWEIANAGRHLDALEQIVAWMPYAVPEPMPEEAKA